MAFNFFIPALLLVGCNKQSPPYIQQSLKKYLPTLQKLAENTASRCGSAEQRLPSPALGTSLEQDQAVVELIARCMIPLKSGGFGGTTPHFEYFKNKVIEEGAPTSGTGVGLQDGRFREETIHWPSLLVKSKKSYVLTVQRPAKQGYVQLELHILVD